MKKRWRFILSSQDGKLEPVLITASIVGILAFVIGKFTGTKVLLFELSSGVVRLAVGMISFLYLYLCWGMKLHRVFSFGDFGTQMVAYLLLVCSVTAFVLIPLGIIQTVGAIIKTMKGKNKKGSP